MNSGYFSEKLNKILEPISDNYFLEKLKINFHVDLDRNNLKNKTIYYHGNVITKNVMVLDVVLYDLYHENGESDSLIFRIKKRFLKKYFSIGYKSKSYNKLINLIDALPDNYQAMYRLFVIRDNSFVAFATVTSQMAKDLDVSNSPSKTKIELFEEMCKLLVVIIGEILERNK